VVKAPGPDPNEMVTGLGCGLSLELISPHLLTARAHTGVPTRCTRDEADPAREPAAAPLSSELWHYKAYPEIPEATWAQPLTREELS
ncbi:MAG: hypothetical protein QOJ56_608, partial [Mycobacterium sp.]|nr:hypothetical protein [Mycobacterium sp.]